MAQIQCGKLCQFCYHNATMHNKINEWRTLHSPLLQETYHKSAVCLYHTLVVQFSFSWDAETSKCPGWAVNSQWPKVPTWWAQSGKAMWSISRQPTVQNCHIIMSSWAQMIKTYGWPLSRQCENPWRFAALGMLSVAHHARTSVTVSAGGRNATVHDPKPYI